MKIGIIGNTRQTLKGLQRLLGINYEIKYVFGLSPKKMKKKVNSVCLKNFCMSNNIKLDTTKFLVKDISLPTGTTLQLIEGDGLYTTCANIRARCNTENGISVYFTYL